MPAAVRWLASLSASYFFPTTPMSDANNDSGGSVPLDEMLQRLKKNNSEKNDSGELVTREDGTQVMRVRKRKRRSQQTKRDKEKKSKKRIIIGAISVVVFAILAALTFVFFLISNNGEARFEEVLAAVEQETGSDATIDNLVIKPTSFGMTALRLEGEGNSVLGDLRVRGVHGEKSLASFFTGSMTGRKILAADGAVHLQLPTDSVGAANVLNGDALDFESYSINRCDFTAGDKDQPVLRINDTNVTLTNRVEGHVVRFRGGAFRFKDLPPLVLGTGFATFDQGDLELRNVTFRTEGGGFIKLEDRLSLEAGFEVNSNISLQDVTFKELGLIRLSQLLTGRISTTSGTVSYTIGEKGEPSLAIPFESGELKLRSLPLLYKISEVFELIDLQPNFRSEVKGVLTVADDVITITDLRLVDTGRFAVTGAIRIAADDSLTGKLLVGVADKIAEDSLGRPILSSLDRKENGFRWAKAELSGTLQNPKDDLARVLRGVQDASDQSEAPEDDPQLDGLFEELLEGGE